MAESWGARQSGGGGWRQCGVGTLTGPHRCGARRPGGQIRCQQRNRRAPRQAWLIVFEKATPKHSAAARQRHGCQSEKEKSERNSTCVPRLPHNTSADINTYRAASRRGLDVQDGHQDDDGCGSHRRGGPAAEVDTNTPAPGEGRGTGITLCAKTEPRMRTLLQIGTTTSTLHLRLTPTTSSQKQKQKQKKKREEKKK